MSEPLPFPRVGVAVLLALLALTLAGFWWFYPANRVERELGRLRVEGSVPVPGGSVEDQGWLCVDTCTWGTRYWATTLPADQAVAAAERLLADRGYERSRGYCEGAHLGRAGSCLAVIHGSRGDRDVTIGVGERRDGRRGFEVSVSVG